MLHLLRAARCLFWLGLSVHLGGIVALAVAAPAIFRTVRETGARAADNPFLQDPSQLGGEIFGNVLRSFSTVELLAATAMALAVVAEIALLRNAARRAWNIIRVALLCAVISMLLYDALALTPAVWQARSAWRNASPEEEPARHAAFTVLHKRSETLGKIKLFLLAGMAVATAIGTTSRPVPNTQPVVPEANG